MDESPAVRHVRPDGRPRASALLGDGAGQHRPHRIRRGRYATGPALHGQRLPGRRCLRRVWAVPAQVRPRRPGCRGDGRAPDSGIRGRLDGEPVLVTAKPPALPRRGADHRQRPLYPGRIGRARALRCSAFGARNRCRSSAFLRQRLVRPSRPRPRPDDPGAGRALRAGRGPFGQRNHRRQHPVGRSEPERRQPRRYRPRRRQRQTVGPDRAGRVRPYRGPDVGAGGRPPHRPSRPDVDRRGSDDPRLPAGGAASISP